MGVRRRRWVGLRHSSLNVEAPHFGIRLARAVSWQLRCLDAWCYQQRLPCGDAGLSGRRRRGETRPFRHGILFLFGCRVCDTVNSACVPAGLRTRGAGDVCSYARAGARWGQPRGRPSYGMRTLHPIEVRTSGPVPFYLRREFLRFVSAAAGRAPSNDNFTLKILYKFGVCNNSTFPRASGSGWRVRGRGVRTQCAPRSTGARTCTPDNL